MRKITTIAVGSIIFMLSSNGIAKTDSAKIDMARAMKRAGLHPNEVGGGIWDLQDGHALLEQRADSLMIPASLSKIVTALTMLDRFPADTQFETSVYVSTPIIDGVVNGDMLLLGGGDPAFVSESMADLVQKIKKTDLKHVRGNLIVDDSRFDQERFDSHRETKRVDRAYDAPVGALSFDWNAVSIYVRPGESVGLPAVVNLEPMSPYLRLENTAVTAAGGEVSISRRQMKSGDLLTVRGKEPLQASEKAYYKSVSSPELWTAANFIQFLGREHIIIDGAVKIGNLKDANYQMIATLKGPLLGELVLSMMKFSNNFIAEMLTKNLAIQDASLKQNASMNNGIAQIKNWLYARRLSGPQWTFVNPSGLTNENKLTPSQIGQLLKFAYSDLKIFPEFTASLPIAGLDGTLKHRARNSEGQIRAKTGLLKDAGVAALAGFATTSAGHTRAFVWIVNQPRAIRNLRNVWDFLDKMATAATELE